MIKIGSTEISSIPGIDKVYAGSDSVLGGGIPSEYTRLEYIVAGGSSALDTGIVVADTDRVIVDEEMESLSASGDKFILGSQQGQTSNIWIETYGSTNKWYVRYGHTSSASYDSTSAQLTGRHSLRLRKNSFDIDGSQFLVLSYTSMPTKSLTIGGRLSSDGVSVMGFYGKLYEAKIVDSGQNPRWRGIPVRETNGTGVGMYDMVSGNFFQSITSSPFTAGPDYTS